MSENPRTDAIVALDCAVCGEEVELAETSAGSIGKCCGFLYLGTDTDKVEVFQLVARFGESQ